MSRSVETGRAALRDELVDVTGLEPATPCLQSRKRKTLNAFAGVAYTENHRNSRSLTVPKLYREFRDQKLLTRNHYRVARCDKNR